MHIKVNKNTEPDAVDLHINCCFQIFLFLLCVREHVCLSPPLYMLDKGSKPGLEAPKAVVEFDLFFF